MQREAVLLRTSCYRVGNVWPDWCTWPNGRGFLFGHWATAFTIDSSDFHIIGIIIIIPKFHKNAPGSCPCKSLPCPRPQHFLASSGSEASKRAFPWVPWPVGKLTLVGFNLVFTGLMDFSIQARGYYLVLYYVFMKTAFQVDITSAREEGEIQTLVTRHPCMFLYKDSLP